MTSQADLIDRANDNKVAAHLMPGFAYTGELINIDEEKHLLLHMADLPFEHFKFHGHEGKRRTVSFGWQYEFSGVGKLHKAGEIPEFLLPVRARAASFAGLPADSLEHVLVIEYGPGAGIGWHRDRPVFGDVIGVSLLAPCVLRFRRKVESHRSTGSAAKPAQSQWQRVNVTAEPRSAYFLTGAARLEWEHSIQRVDQLRYSVTFRTMLQLSK
jgi:alkylated DNA repair dioxygenase AlkB